LPEDIAAESALFFGVVAFCAAFFWVAGLFVFASFCFCDLLSGDCNLLREDFVDVACVFLGAFAAVTFALLGDFAALFIFFAVGCLRLLSDWSLDDV
jgi:hypothetical protein